jgi:RCC1 and BTB domain-containing protein
MSGQRSADSEGAAESVAAGCNMRETPRNRDRRHNEVITASSYLRTYEGFTSLAGTDGGLAVFTWGRGEDGQLGLGDTSDQDEPTYVDALRGVGVRQIACGSGHTVVLTTDGEVFTWGRGDDGRLGHGDNGWKYVPRIIQSLTGQVVVQVTCGSYHTAAVTGNGDLYTWGGGMYGKLGHGNEAGCSTPKRVDGLVGLVVSKIACGSRHTAVVTNTGVLYTWGDKENGVAGHGDTEGYVFLGFLLS